MRVGDTVEMSNSSTKVRPFRVGDKVLVKKTLLYNGRVGILEHATGEETFWDWHVNLDEVPGLTEKSRVIGITESQIEQTK